MKKLLIGCGALIVLVVVAAAIGIMALPSSYSVERELDMKATPEAAYETIAKLSSWPEWTVWNKEMDPGATWEFSGPESGDGAMWSWTGEELGTGELTLRDCAAPNSVTYDLVMEGGEYSSVGTFTITQKGEGINVHWVNGGELEGMGKLFGPMIEGLTGPMYEQGLQGLKARLESATAAETTEPAESSE